MTSDIIYDTVVKQFDDIATKLVLYLDDPNKVNLHNIRTSIRRLESAYMIVPKSSRTRSSERFVKLVKKLFNTSSKLRDYDIILDKLSKYNIDPESRLCTRLVKRYKKRQSRTLELVQQLVDAKPAKIRNFKSSSKFKRVLSEMIDRFTQNIPKVICDESNVDELHDLRKELKRLRYILELGPHEIYLSVVSNMKYLQRLLGDIHDSDIFVSYLQRHGQDIDDVITLEQERRNTKYAMLVSGLSST